MLCSLVWWPSGARWLFSAFLESLWFVQKWLDGYMATWFSRRDLVFFLKKKADDASHVTRAGFVF
jgi:hypothetical protein